MRIQFASYSNAHPWPFPLPPFLPHVLSPSLSISLSLSIFLFSVHCHPKEFSAETEGEKFSKPVLKRFDRFAKSIAKMVQTSCDPALEASLGCR